jgi:hypothetical protein
MIVHPPRFPFPPCPYAGPTEKNFHLPLDEHAERLT